MAAGPRLSPGTAWSAGRAARTARTEPGSAAARKGSQTTIQAAGRRSLPRQRGARGRPGQPTGQHQPHGDLIPVKDHHQLAQKHDLGDGGGEANLDSQRANSESGPHITRISRRAREVKAVKAGRGSAGAARGTMGASRGEVAELADATDSKSVVLH